MIITGVAISGVFLVLDIILGSVMISNYLLTLEYYPAFIATGVGVLIALVLQEALTTSKQEKRMEEMGKILTKELQRMYDLVIERKGNHLDTQVWDSLISSGHASLFPTELQDVLFEIYPKVGALNIETSRARDAAEAHRRQPTEDTKRAHIELSIRIDSMELDLQNILHSFLEARRV